MRTDPESRLINELTTLASPRTLPPRCRSPARKCHHPTTTFPKRTRPPWPPEATHRDAPPPCTPRRFPGSFRYLRPSPDTSSRYRDHRRRPGQWPPSPTRPSHNLWPQQHARRSPVLARDTIPNPRLHRHCLPGCPSSPATVPLTPQTACISTRAGALAPQATDSLRPHHPTRSANAAHHQGRPTPSHPMGLLANHPRPLRVRI